MEGFLLNEQTWLQHLKEKRLAYGLSQNRLAVATGITRQYLSDIETGKVKPSEDLQQSLWEALERFNPDAPLEMLFDYVRIRFPTTDVQQVVENILQLKLSYFLHEDYGFYSYSEHYALGDIFVLCSHELDKGVLVELKGRGCRQLIIDIWKNPNHSFSPANLFVQPFQHIGCTNPSADIFRKRQNLNSIFKAVF